MPAYAEGVVLAGPVAEDGGHVLELPLSVFVEADEGWDGGDLGTVGGVVGYGGDGVYVAHAVNVFGFWVGCGVVGGSGFLVL